MSKIVVKDFREQILLRPEMWFGDFSVKTEKLMYYSSKFEIGNKTYSPALLKMFDEVITNCTDVYSKYPKINGKLNPKHYDSIIDYTLSIGVKNGWKYSSNY